MKFIKYSKDLDYSYTLGILPTLELLGYRPEQIIKIVYSAKGQKHESFSDLYNICTEKSISIELDEKQIERLSQKDNTTVIAFFRKYDMTLESRKNHVLLYQPADIGNLGMIIRSSLGFNVENVGIISPGVDCFNPLVIRASMGALFNCNIAYFATLEEYLQKYSNNLYIFDIKGEELLQNVSIKKPFTFLFGTEGDGLPDDLLSEGHLVKIPYDNKAVESLNLANSVSIALYQQYTRS